MLSREYHDCMTAVSDSFDAAQRALEAAQKALDTAKKAYAAAQNLGWTLYNEVRAAHPNDEGSLAKLV